MAKAIYVTIDLAEDVMLPTGKETSRVRAEEAAGEAENLVVVGNKDELFKACKLRELVTLHNSVVEAQNAVANLGNKRDASAAAFDAMAAYDYEQPASHQEPVERSRGRKSVGKSLAAVTISINTEAYSKLAGESIRAVIYAALVAFQGDKPSVGLVEFKESLDEEMQPKMMSAIRALIRACWVTAQIEKDGELEPWGHIDENAKAAFIRRQEAAAERDRLKAAKKEQAEADKKAKAEAKAKAKKPAKKEKAEKAEKVEKRSKPSKK